MDRRKFLGWSAGTTVLANATVRAAAASPGFGAAIETLARLLADHYVSPDVGRRYAADMRAKLTQGVYANIHDARVLATRLTADLAAVSPDGHLRVATIASLNREDLPRDVTPPPTAPDAPVARAPRRLAIEDAGWLADRVAYIRFTEFPDDPAIGVATAAFMRDHAAARALIVDCRYNGGGGVVPMNAMLPFLFARSTTLVALDVPTRVEQARGFAFAGEGGFRSAPGPAGISRHIHFVTPQRDETRLFDVPVYLLVSKRTACAAEHLALALKRTRRATLIGEATAGANHFGEFESIGNGLAAFIPVGRTLDPDTGRDWEGVGIMPDVPIAAPLALQEALRRAGTQ